MQFTFSIPDEDIRCFLLSLSKKESETAVKKIQSASAPASNVPLSVRVDGVKIKELPLLEGTKRRLYDHRIYTLKDLLRCSRNALTRFDKIGQATMYDIDRFMESRGFKYGSLPPFWVPDGLHVRFTDEEADGIWMGYQASCTPYEEAKKRNAKLGIC